jgi:translation initiation factor 5
LYQALFTELGPAVKLAAALKDAAPLLKATASYARGQLAQLLALEWLLAVGAPQRVKEGALALKVLYDEDLAEEEIILEWADRADAAKVLGVDAAGAKAVRAAVAAVVEWLQEADDDSESDAGSG